VLFRSAFVLIFACATSAAMSETVVVSAPITAVVDLPTGRHQVQVPFTLSEDGEVIDVTVDGGQLVGYVIQPSHGEAAQSWDALDAARAEVDRIKLDIDRITADVSAARLPAEAAPAIIDAIGKLAESSVAVGGEQMTELSAAARAAILDVMGAAQAADQEAERLAQDLVALRVDLALAQSRVDEIQSAARLITANALVDMPNAGEASIVVSYGALDAGWEPVYDVNLISAVPSVELTRSVRVGQSSGEDWRDVSLTLSTVELSQPLRLGALWPLSKRIVAPPSGSYGSLAEAPLIEPIIVEETGALSAVRSDLGTTYSLPDPVTILTGDAALILPLDRVMLAADVTARAVPRLGDGVFRHASLVNHMDEEILPASDASFRVDGEWVGSGRFERVGPGASVHLGFGRVPGLTVRRDVVSRSIGDRGVIARSNVRSAWSRSSWKT